MPLLRGILPQLLMPASWSTQRKFVSLCYHIFFSHLHYSNDCVLKHLKLHTLVTRRRYLGVLFLINIFNGSKHCPTTLKTVCLSVLHRNFRNFSLFNIDAKSYNCHSARCASAAMPSLVVFIYIYWKFGLYKRFASNFMECLPCIFIRLRIITSKKCTSICLLDIQTLLHVSALLGLLQGVIHYRIWSNDKTICGHYKTWFNDKTMILFYNILTFKRRLWPRIVLQGGSNMTGIICM
jgi:hypothetical protein